MRPTSPCRPCQVLVIDGDRRASQTAEVLFASGHWARCATSAAAVMHAVRSHHFDALLVNTKSFGGDTTLLLRQVRTLYSVAAVELLDQPHWFEKRPVDHEGFEHSVRNPVTPARLMKALRQVADRQPEPPAGDSHRDFPNRC